MNTRIKKAAKILAKYNLTLAPEWAGKINCWHRWHQNDFYLCWLTTYEEYVGRIIDIEANKSENEKSLRFLAFHPVKDEVLRLLDLAPAWEAYEKAKATASEAYDKAKAPVSEAYDKALAPASEAYEKAKATVSEAYNKATATARDAYEKAISPAWEAYHKAISPAREAYVKAIDTASEAYDKAISPAREAYEKAIDTARIKCHFDAGVDIMAIHRIECADVPLIESTNELKF